MPSTHFRTEDDELESTARGAPADDFDALADLFLGEDEPAPALEKSPPNPRASEAPAAREQAMIELLVQGHLPVRAAPWASQYARLRATATRGRVALIRLVGGHLSVELFGDENAAAPSADAPEALRAAATGAAHCIVQLDEVHQAAIAGDPRVAAVTVLAGSNEAAVVAAYRTLKGLAAVLAPAADHADPSTELQVALVAPDEASATDALERLRRASAVFLDRPLISAGTLGKIVPTGAVPLYRGECAIGPGRLLDLLNAPNKPEPMRAAKSPDSPVPATRVPEDLSLARFIEGLRETRISCPDDPRVALAVSADGRLHLLRRDHDGCGIERLTGVAAWAVKHAAILTAAGLSADFDQAPVLHLFTETPKAVRHLLDAPVRLHFLKRVGGEWCRIELN